MLKLYNNNIYIKIKNTFYSKMSKELSQNLLLFSHILRKIETQNDIDSIDTLYGFIDNLVALNDFSTIDQLTNIFINSDFKLRLLVSLLTITHPYRNMLKSREKLKTKAISVAEVQGLKSTQISGILSGF